MKCHCHIAKDETNICDAIYDGWYCTQIKGHEGNHIACGFSRCEAREWPQDNAMQKAINELSAFGIDAEATKAFICKHISKGK